MEAVLFRVVEVSDPGPLPPGRYVAVRGGRVIFETTLTETTRPSALIPEVRRLKIPA